VKDVGQVRQRNETQPAAAQKAVGLSGCRLTVERAQRASAHGIPAGAIPNAQ